MEILAETAADGVSGLTLTLPSPSALRPLSADLEARVDRAAEVFADNGLTATRIEEVARVTGVPKATLYYYFSGKEHILAHLLSRTLTQMTRRLEQAAAGSGTGRERVERLVREHLRFIATHGPTYRLLFAELGKAASLVDIAAGVDRAVLAPLRAALRAGAADGSLRVDDARVAASVVYGAVLVSGMDHLLARRSDDVEAEADALLDALLGGLGARSRRDRGRRAGVSGPADGDRQGGGR